MGASNGLRDRLRLVYVQFDQPKIHAQGAQQLFIACRAQVGAEESDILFCGHEMHGRTIGLLVTDRGLHTFVGIHRSLLQANLPEADAANEVDHQIAAGIRLLGTEKSRVPHVVQFDPVDLEALEQLADEGEYVAAHLKVLVVDPGADQV